MTFPPKATVTFPPKATVTLPAVGIVGGTGPFGKGFAVRASHLGMRVTLGSRDAARAQAAATALDRSTVRGGTNRESIESSELVVLAVPFEAHAHILNEIGPWVAGRLLLDVTVPFSRDHAGYYVPQERSFAEATQAACPEARVVSAFHTIAAGRLRRVPDALEQDVLYCGDDPQANSTVAAVIEAAGARAVDCGPLAVARVLEGLGAVVIGLNLRYSKRNLGVRIEGL